MKRCIYCMKLKPEGSFNREHVLPRSFGTFGSRTPVLNCVCEECNSYFSENLEVIFARQTIEGVSRITSNLHSSEESYTDNERIIMKLIDRSDTLVNEVYVRLNLYTKNIEPLPQIHLLNKETHLWEIFLSTKWQDIAWDAYSKCKAFAPNEEKLQEILSILNEHGMRDFLSLPEPQVNEEGFLIQMQWKIDRIVRRALCKILYNFSAYYISEEEVLKVEWEDMRNYIRFDNGNIDMFFEENGFWGEESRNLRFDPNGINIRIQNSRNNGLIGEIEFYNKIHYCFKINPSYTLSPEKQIAKRFVCGEHPVDGHPIRSDLYLPSRHIVVPY